MTKYESFDHCFFEKIEDFFDCFNSFEFYELLRYSCENFDFFREISNESFVEINEINENLYFFQICKAFSIDYDFNFFQIHAKIVNRKQYIQKNYYFFEKFALVNVDLKIVFFFNFSNIART